MSLDPSTKTIPRATYRIQFSRCFGFRDAARLVPRLAKLGISHVYASPYLQARPGSSHGYDITDHCRLNPELGDDEDFAAFVSALADAGMGQILDFVPNHMGVGGADNAWWLDALEWGETSPYAGFFDIDWEPDRRYLAGKVLVPFLGDQYGAVLEAGELVLIHDANAGEFAVWAHGIHKLPLCPADYGRIIGEAHPELERLADSFRQLPAQGPHMRQRAADLKRALAALTASEADAMAAVTADVARLNGRPGVPDDFDALDRIIQNQHWRVADFRVAADDINYRRFFNINELAGLRMEQPELFDLTHRLVFQLIAEGKLDGLRIDHIDGLLDPKGYCQRLVAQAPRPVYLVVEKILARHERLRNDWPVDGTTGYDFATLATGLFIDPAGEAAMTRIYEIFTGCSGAFADLVRDAKLRIMTNEMASELTALARCAGQLARSHRRSCDFTNNILGTALRETIARFPVYRTYVGGDGPQDDDRRDLDWAIAQARRSADAPDPSVFDFLHQALTSDLVARPHSGFSRQAVLRLAMKVQQYSGPVMAKGLEDTAFYRYNRLLALNEVGGHPDSFGTTVAAFHAANGERLRYWPDTMLATSTHDTKRGEDARARLAVLAEFPDEWERRVEAWTRLLRARRGDVERTAPPRPNDEYMIYQMLIGAWPAEMTGRADDGAAMTCFTRRMEAAVIKAIREARTHSSWTAPDLAYEDAATGLVRDALSRSNAFLDSFLPFQARVAHAGMVNSLGQTLLKLTVPGVPDIYQGAELWDLALVDPDNRRPVDFASRAALLDRLAEAPPGSIVDLLDDWPNGAIKLAVIHRALALRRRMPHLFARGGYTPVDADGGATAHLCAFLRHTGDDLVLVLVSRLPIGLEARGGWGDTSLRLPANVGPSDAGYVWKNCLTGRCVAAAAKTLGVADILDGLPVALLVAER